MIMVATKIITRNQNVLGVFTLHFFVVPFTVAVIPSPGVTREEFGSVPGHQQRGYKLEKAICYSDTNSWPWKFFYSCLPNFYLPLIYGNKDIGGILVPDSPFPQQFP